MVRLKENQSLEIDRTGVVVARQAANARRFVRAMPSRLCRCFPELFGGKVVFEQRFDADSSTPAKDYPDLTPGLCEPDKDNPKASAAVVRDGVLQLHRHSTVRREDVAMTARKFSGRMLVSVDIGSDAENVGFVAVALHLGHLRFFIGPGSAYGLNLEGVFFVDRTPEDVDRKVIEMRFIPAVDVLATCLFTMTGKTRFECAWSTGQTRPLFSAPPSRTRHPRGGVPRRGRVRGQDLHGPVR